MFIDADEQNSELEEERGIWSIFVGIALTLTLAVAYLYALEAELAAGLVHPPTIFQTEGPRGKKEMDFLVSKKDGQYLWLLNQWKDHQLRSPLRESLRALQLMVTKDGYQVQFEPAYLELCDRAASVFPQQASGGVADPAVRLWLATLCHDAVKTGRVKFPATNRELAQAVARSLSGKPLSDKEEYEGNSRVDDRVHPENLRLLAIKIRQDLSDLRAEFAVVQLGVVKCHLLERLASEPEGTAKNERGIDKVVAELSKSLRLLPETRGRLKGL